MEIWRVDATCSLKPHAKSEPPGTARALAVIARAKGSVSHMRSLTILDPSTILTHIIKPASSFTTVEPASGQAGL
ncbi:MAG: hypothetical protein ACI9MR_002707 [Myxococcota bacterium]|jgi:hypothetical protein